MLSQAGTLFEERDFFKEPFSEDEIGELAKARPVTELFSWNSPSFKGMGLQGQQLRDRDLIRLMLKEPRLIRRPIIAIGNKVIVGFNQTALKMALEEEK